MKRLFNDVIWNITGLTAGWLFCVFVLHKPFFGYHYIYVVVTALISIMMGRLIDRWFEKRKINKRKKRKQLYDRFRYTQL